MRDDGPNAAGAVVLTHRFWTTDAQERSVRARQDRPARHALGHHRGRAGTLGAVSGGNRAHRQRRDQPASPVGHDGDRPRASDDRAVRPARARRRPRAGARRAAHASTPRMREAASRSVLCPRPTSGSRPCACATRSPRGARTVLLVLLAASVLVFVIACSNVANLILARTVRREGELAIRAALGASTAALRRTLLAESLLLCGAGAALGVLSARPMLAILARYASRFSVRALDLTVDSEHALGRRRSWPWSRRCCWRSCRACRRPTARTGSAWRAGGLRITGGTSAAAARSSRSRRSPRPSCCWPAPACCSRRCSRCRRRRPASTRARCWR